MHDADELFFLSQFGQRLDRFGDVRVFNSGVVGWDSQPADVQYSDTEANHAKRKSKRSATRSRKRPAARKRQAGSPRGAGSSGRRECPLVSFDVPAHLAADLAEVVNAYPDAKYFPQTSGVWLVVESSLSSEFSTSAVFAVAIPYDTRHRVLGWAYWKSSQGIDWIGPRHTNFGKGSAQGEGSICAFDLRDGNWKHGDSLVALIDLYTVWTLRQAHLKAFGWWPGKQSAPHPFERISEFKDEEWCGCDNPKGRYRDCCKEADLSVPVRVHRDVFYSLFGSFGARSGPSDVENFVRCPILAPDLSKFFPRLP